MTSNTDLYIGVFEVSMGDTGVTEILITKLAVLGRILGMTVLTLFGD